MGDSLNWDHEIYLFFFHVSHCFYPSVDKSVVLNLTLRYYYDIDGFLVFSRY